MRGVDQCGNGCQNPESAESHSCPYLEDIRADGDSQCHCCEACEYQCAMDI